MEISFSINTFLVFFSGNRNTEKHDPKPGWLVLGHPDSGTSVFGPPLLKPGWKAGSSAPVSGEPPHLPHPLFPGYSQVNSMRHDLSFPSFSFLQLCLG